MSKDASDFKSFYVTLSVLHADLQTDHVEQFDHGYQLLIGSAHRYRLFSESCQRYYSKSYANPSKRQNPRLYLLVIKEAQ